MKTRIWFTMMTLVVCALLAASVAHAQETPRKVFTAKKGGTLTVKVTGNITIESWNKDEVELTVSGADAESMKKELEFANNDGNVTVELKDNNDWCDDCNYHFNVPAQYNLSLNTVGGDIHIVSSLTGNFQVMTKGGDIKMSDCIGDADALTAGGDILSGNISGNVKFRTAGGAIKTGNIGGEASIATASGDVRVGNVVKTASISTAGGDIHIGEADRDVKTSTAGGDIVIGKANGKVTVSTAGGDIKVGSGNGYTKVSTAGGDILLDNIHGAVKASSAGGDVSVKLFPEGTEDCKLSSASGKVELSLPASVKATVQATVKGIMPEELEKNIVCEFASDKSTEVKEGKKNQRVFTINGGGQLIQLESVNSIIEIKKIK